MKKVLVGAMALLTLAACSNEEVLQKNEVKQEINFTAVTGKALSRAVDGFCNKSLPGEIYVSASYKSSVSAEYAQYFLNDVYTSGTPYTSSVARYWPSFTGEQKLKFFATTSKDGGGNSIIEPKWVVGSKCEKMMLENYIVDTDVSKQHDLLYAVTTVEAMPSSGVQTINFRHALSQIEFMAKNENSKIHVEICGVSIVHVNNQGTFTFFEDTDDNIENHGFGGTEASNVGVWSALSGDEAYTVSFDPQNIASTATELTTKDDAGKEYSANTMYLIPQGITAWDRATTPKAVESSDTYFLIKAKIWNIAGTVFTPGTDVILWGTGDSGDVTGAKDIAIPATDITWEPGKRYVYTFVFTTSGEGGADPDSGKDVLTPIKLKVTVDDFVKGSDETVNMTK